MHMQVALEREIESSEQRLIFFFFDASRGGYNIIDHDDVTKLQFIGRAREAAWALIEGALLFLRQHDFHVYTAFPRDNVTYYPIQVTFGVDLDRDPDHLAKKGFRITPLLEHPLGEDIRRSAHLEHVRHQ